MKRQDDLVLKLDTKRPPYEISKILPFVESAVALLITKDTNAERIASVVSTVQAKLAEERVARGEASEPAHGRPAPSPPVLGARPESRKPGSLARRATWALQTPSPPKTEAHQ